MQQGAVTPIRRGSRVVGVASPITGYRRVPKSPPKTPLSTLIKSPVRLTPQTPRSPVKSGAEHQLAVFFFQCDEYRTGQVKKVSITLLSMENSQETNGLREVEFSKLAGHLLVLWSPVCMQYRLCLIRF